MTTTYFSLASGDFSQDWSNTGQITTDEDWSGVPSIVAYRGDDLTTSTGTDPRNITTDSAVIDVIANQTNPNITNGGVAEFQIADPTIALQGSGTADAPYVVLYLDATGRKDLHLDVDLRDIDGSADNAVQPLAVQYRIGETVAWTNLDGGYVADATTGPSQATQVTHLSLDLPALAAGQSQVQIRFITTNAVGSDEWIGVDNIHVTSAAQTGTTVSIDDVSITEGDAGDQLMTFTVTRSDTSGDFSVDYASANGTATAGSDYEAASGTLHFAAGGPATQTISVTIHGDTDVEPNEAFTLALSNIQNTTGSATLLGTGVATGTITNDDVALIHIYDIQGAGHTSPFVGQHVTTSGVVTAIDTTGSRGFWIQDPTGDGNDATSDAVFVFTGATPTVTVGQLVQVEGNVNEYGGSDPNNLTITEIESPIITVLGTGTVAPTIIGEGGRLPPTEVVEDDNFTVFDPAHDAADFYESLEGMLVTVKDAQAVDATSGNSTWVVSDLGANATGMNGRGGITISDGDINPERVQIFYDSGVAPVGVKPDATIGDHLGDVTGVVSYFGGNYEVLPTAIGSTGTGAAPARETTSLTGDATHVTIGAYNVENLDPTDPQAKFDQLGYDIAHNLGAPDIVGLEEIQDADGAGNGTDYSGAATAQKLIDAIAAAGGPHYVYIEIAPTANNTTGGESNGNIRQGFLYNPDRVSYVAGSIHQLTDTDLSNGDAYANSRKPLVADFTFAGETITVVDVHNYSRGGSEEPFGKDQPPLNNGDDRRLDQTTPVKQYVEGLVASDPDAKVVVMGDFNAFQFEPSLTQLESGGALTNLATLLTPTDRFSYAYEGNAQEIDHALASPDLFAGAEFDIVHLNTGQSSDARPTDHDPIVSRFYVNAAPTAHADTASVNEDATVVIDVLANDTDPDAFDQLVLVSVSSTAKGASVSIVDGKVAYTADADVFDLLTPGQTASDSFTYVMRDAGGETSTATVTVTIGGVADGPTQTGGNGADSLLGAGLDEKLDGGNGNDTVDGGAGTDTVMGGNGDDDLRGGAGLDSLSGANGNDTLTGGDGDDVLAGGRGSDMFVFGPHFGHDTLVDFKPGDDEIRLVDAGFADFADLMAHAVQAGANIVITSAAGDSLQLNNLQLASLHAGDFLFA